MSGVSGGVTAPGTKGEVNGTELVHQSTHLAVSNRTCPAGVPPRSSCSPLDS